MQLSPWDNLKGTGRWVTQAPYQLITKGNMMAEPAPGTNPNMDYAAHNSTYASVLRITKYGIIFLVLLLVAMRYFLVP